VELACDRTHELTESALDSAVNILVTAFPGEVAIPGLGEDAVEAPEEGISVVP
jgi:hypothetical protein